MAVPRRQFGLGFTLIEVMVVVALIGIALSQALPAIASAYANARARAVVTKFVQDFAWLRNTAAVNATTAVVLVVNADCSWTSTLNGTTDAAHSTTTAALAKLAPGMGCSLSSAVTFNFTSQGFVDNSATIGFPSAGGQSWPLLILNSGSVTNTTGAS